MTQLPFVGMGRFGSEHDFNLGHITFEMAFQHPNESGFGLRNRNHHGCVKKTQCLTEQGFQIEFTSLYLQVLKSVLDSACSV